MTNPAAAGQRTIRERAGDAGPAAERIQEAEAHDLNQPEVEEYSKGEALISV